jgi:hypothetical protein
MGVGMQYRYPRYCDTSPFAQQQKQHSTSLRYAPAKPDLPFVGSKPEGDFYTGSEGNG